MGGFLAKVGALLLKGVGIIGGLGLDGKAGVVAGRVSDTLEEIARIVSMIEAAGQAIEVKGPQKLIMATPAVTQIVLSSLVAGKKIQDKEKFRASVQTLISAVVGILNSVDEDGAKEENP